MSPSHFSRHLPTLSHDEVSGVDFCRLSAIVWGDCIREPILNTIMQSQLSIAVCHAGTDSRIFHHAIFMILIQIITFEFYLAAHFLLNRLLSIFNRNTCLFLLLSFAKKANRLPTGLRFMYHDNFCDLQTIVKLFCVIAIHILPFSHATCNSNKVSYS